MVSLPADVVLPKLDRLMTEGVVQEWLKKRSEEVSKGEAIAVIETEKVTVELEAQESGVFIPLVAEKSRVKVGDRIALIVRPGEKVPEVISQPTVQSSTEAPSTVQIKTGRKIIPASPAARKLARELGVNLTDIKPSGTGGRIVEEDVASYAQRARPVTVPEHLAPQEPEEAQAMPLTGWRKVMADRVMQSTLTTARVTTVAEVDATEMVSLKEKLRRLEESIEAKITYTAFVVKAVTVALRQFPIINSTLVGDAIAVSSAVNIGVAVANEKSGLVVPVIYDADKKDLVKIAQELEALSKKARENKLTLQEVSGGTFTITNPGMMGVILDTPIINIPQCAILGVGAIVKRAGVVADQIAIRSMMFLSLSYDHRITEGLPAIRFLQRVKQLLEDPYQFLIGGIHER